MTATGDQRSAENRNGSGPWLARRSGSIAGLMDAVAGISTFLAAFLSGEAARRTDRGARAAKKLLPDKVTVLDVYGHLFYAGARTLERLLPTPQDAQNPVVVLRLHGLTTVGATLLNMLSTYTDKLEEVGGGRRRTDLAGG